MAPPPSIPDEITAFLNKNQEDLHLLPAVINIAFSGERKPEAWHVKLVNKQVTRGFNKSAPITIMLALKTWRQLLKKNDRTKWLNAVQESQIHIHGDEAGKNAVIEFFSANGETANGTPKPARKMSKAKLIGAAHKNGTAKSAPATSPTAKTKVSSKAKRLKKSTADVTKK